MEIKAVLNVLSLHGVGCPGEQVTALWRCGRGVGTGKPVRLSPFSNKWRKCGRCPEPDNSRQVRAFRGSNLSKQAGFDYSGDSLTTKEQTTFPVRVCRGLAGTGFEETNFSFF